jgi:hypothetical protein
MDVICAACKRKYGEKPGDGISHGMCLACAVRLYPDLDLDRNKFIEIKEEANVYNNE